MVPGRTLGRNSCRGRKSKDADISPASPANEQRSAESKDPFQYTTVPRSTIGHPGDAPEVLKSRAPFSSNATSDRNGPVRAIGCSGAAGLGICIISKNATIIFSNAYIAVNKTNSTVLGMQSKNSASASASRRDFKGGVLG
jgi:hypothetical protein